MHIYVSAAQTALALIGGIALILSLIASGLHEPDGTERLDP